MSPSEWERQQLRTQRERLAAEREERLRYLQSRAAEVDRQNASIDQRLEQLRGLLLDGLDDAPGLNFDRLLADVPLDLGDLGVPVPAPIWEYFAPKPLGMVGRLLGGDERYQRRVEESRRKFEQALAIHSRMEAERRQRAQSALKRHDREHAPKRERIRRLQRGWREREKMAVEQYLELSLGGLKFPPGFPRAAEVAFDPRTDTAVVKVQLPDRDVIPAVRRSTYVKSRDDVRVQHRSPRETADLYRSIISQVVLLRLHAALRADLGLKSATINGHLRTIDPKTGLTVNPCLISVSVDRSMLENLQLRQVEPEACLRHLNALVSPHPLDLEPVTPILDFAQAKYAFVEGVDAAAGLDARPILTDLSPTEFEHLVRQLCEAAGLQAWTTRQSNDDGVDAVVFNPDPMLGGESIVQAKRYKTAIGPQHIRELAGAMEEKRASRAILMTTSWFTPGARRKAAEHNRMTLMDGQNLVALIKEHLGKDVLAGAVPPQQRR